MRLRNKKTGEIGKLHCDMNVSPAKYGVFEDTDIRGHYWEYNSLAELNEEWEDYEEPKEYYWIDSITSTIQCAKIGSGGKYEEFRKSIGNYFETEEEAEKAVEKLKAWKRLKDKGFQFESWFGWSKDISFWIDTEIDEDIAKDLDLLFGGEE